MPAVTNSDWLTPRRADWSICNATTLLLSVTLKAIMKLRGRRMKVQGKLICMRDLWFDAQFVKTEFWWEEL